MNSRILWNNDWSFAKTELDTEYEVAMNEHFEHVDIPHDWLIYDTNNLYADGIGWYRKSFTADVEEGERLLVEFGAVYMNSTIYLNGVAVCEWKYGYSTFRADITDYVKNGENVLVVKVVYQSPNTRWYSGAGIIRDVYLLKLPKSHIVPDGIYFRTEQKTEKTWAIKCLVSTENAEGCTVRLTLKNADETEVLLLEANHDGCEFEFDMENPKVWDITSPELYDLSAELLKDGQVICKETIKVGFAKKEYSPEHGFLLNGRKVRIFGACEHHDLGCLGAAFNRSAFRRKLVKLRRMGVNAIRTTHNMPDKAVMELADEMGFLVVSEAFDMWEKPKTEYDYARFFKDWAKKDVKSWVMRDRNHVSLIMWSIGNEIYDTHCDEHGLEITKRLYSYVREYDYDANAPVTIGSNYMPWENARKCADVLKIAGYNYAEKYYDEHHEKYPDWVIYGSETSSTLQSRGVYKFPYSQAFLSDDDEQCTCLGNCTTSWGAKNTEYCITMDRDREYSMGQFIWTGFDYIGEPTPYQTKNSYFGQLDTAGFEKDTYYIYQAEWTDYRKEPMVHVFPYWDFSPEQLIDIRVASNAPRVELFVNGELIGGHEIDHAHGKDLLAHFTVPYVPGSIRAVAYDEFGNCIAEDEHHSFSDAVALVAEFEEESIKADGRDRAFLNIIAVDKDGYPVENATNRVKVKVEGAGRLVGMDNGNSTDYDQYKTDNRRMFSGKLLAVVGSTFDEGEIKVTVTSPGLKECVAFIKSEKAAAVIGVSADERIENCETICEVPVRNITLTCLGSTQLDADNRTVMIRADIHPENATYKDLIWQVTNEAGVESNCAEISVTDNVATINALGDGDIVIRCMSKNGTDKIKLISTASLKITGLGLAEFDPYGFVAGSLFTRSDIEPAMGLDRGVVTARDKKSYVAYDKVNFGKNGSDTLTIPVYELENRPFPIEIWKGIPGEGTLIDTVTYDLPSIWATYQEKTFVLPERFKGLCTISFVAEHEINIKGFSFKKYEKAYDKNYATDADSIYGDTYTVEEDGVKGIGNNVSLTFNDMNFAQGISKLTICGASTLPKNTIHVRFSNGEESINQIAEFVTDSADEAAITFPMENISGNYTVNFVFLPGCKFDFKWFKFE